MGVVTISDFESDIKNKEIKHIYYIYGRDTGTVERLAASVKKKVLGSSFSSSDYNRLDGKAFDVSKFADLTEMYPMFTDYNFIEINDLNADDLNADDLKSLIKIFENIPEKTVILITITGFDVKNGKKVPGAKNKKVIDASQKCGIVVEAELRKPTELYKYINQRVLGNGSSISRDDAEYIAQMCLGNTLAIDNETDKLCSYANGEQITRDMIDKMVTVQLDTNAFALASAVVSFNASAAFRILDELVQERTEGVVILSAISSAFIDLYRARTAIDASLRESDVISDFLYRGREFVVRNAFRDARKISTGHLRKCLNILCTADLECKSTRLDQKIIIEKAIAQMLMQRNGGR